MKKSPLIVFTGLAVAAVAGVLGVTRDRWMGDAPVTAATEVATSGETVTKTEEPAAAKAEEPAAATTTAAEQTVAATEVTAAEQEAPKVVAETAPEEVAKPAEQPAVEQQAAATEEAPETTTTTAEQSVEVSAATSTETPEAAAEAEVKPAFDTVRVEKTGEAVIAGTAEAGSEVVVKLDGETIGTATANADGAFVVVPEKALPQGSGAITIESKSENETTAVKSDQSVAIIVPAAEEKKEALVAVISPDEPTKVLQKPSADAVQSPVSLDAVDYDAEGNIVFNGRAAAGQVVRLYVDNAVAGDAEANAEGRWTFTGATAMTPGNHMLRVDAIDAAGKVTSRVELPFVREDQVKVAAATETTTTEITKTEPAAETSEQVAATTTTTTEVTTETKPKDGRVVIQPGNNLWRISKVIYGDGKKYSMIFEANKDLIRDPDMIFPGQIFETPNVVPPEKIDPAERDPIATAQ
jgi:nucleoid-associated protein YgaU